VRLAVFVLLTVAIVSCTRKPPDATPEGALREWIEHMQAQVTDPHETRAAYAMLSKATHENLEKRAVRASRIEGRRVEPYEVMAEGRFALRFEPTHFTTTTAGAVATIDVTGEDPTDRASMHAVKEGAVWRVELALPDLPDLPHRPEN
jgi:hypothetical protein